MQCVVRRNGIYQMASFSSCVTLNNFCRPRSELRKKECQVNQRCSLTHASFLRSRESRNCPSLDLFSRHRHSSEASERHPSVIKVSATSAMTVEKKILVPIGHGSEEMEAVIIADVLRRSGAQVTVASVEQDTLTIIASRKVKIVADSYIKDCQSEKYDLIVFPGGMPGSERLRDSAILREITEEHVGRDQTYAAICAAPAVVLKSWNLLNDRKATAHPAFVSQLLKSLPDRVVSDGPVITSQGPGTAFEFSLKLVEHLYGKESMEKLKGPMVMRLDDGTDVALKEHNPSNYEGSGIPKVLVPIANGSEEMEAVIVIDVLRRSGAQVTVASIEHNSLTITASRNVKLEADVSMADVADQEFDLIVLPGGMPGAERLRDSAELDSLLRKHAEASKLIAAICASPSVVFLPKGLLQGKKATAHPAFSGQLPDQTDVPARVVTDGNFITSRGPGTAMEFSLVLVEKLFGKDRAADVGAPMVL